MDSIIELLRELINPDWIMAHGGLFLVAFIIFAETGLFVGFLLPGDSLLFITGMIIAGAKNNPVPFESHPLNLVFWIILLTIAAILGNMVGYWFGKKSGPLLFERKETWIFKRKHLQSAHDFYEKRGGAAIIIARFLPIVRTFAPIVAGVVKMDYKKFVSYNIIGAALWIVSITTIGFLLGENVWIKEQLEWIILGLILITTLPVIFKMIFGKRRKTVTVI
ncbi:MAG TPA: VTT domain-containing protein [Hanamia sp.]|nr:VTT domain-containing protein [Hanamia sp.]